MISFLIYMNNFILNLTLRQKKKLEWKMQYKKIKKLIQKKKDQISLLKCQEGYLILILDSKNQLEIKQWIEDNIFDRSFLIYSQKENDFISTEEISEDASSLDSVDTPLDNSTAKDSEPPYKLTDLTISVQTPEGIKPLAPETMLQIQNQDAAKPFTASNPSHRQHGFFR